MSLARWKEIKFKKTLNSKMNFVNKYKKIFSKEQWVSEYKVRLSTGRIVYPMRGEYDGFGLKELGFKEEK